MNQQPKTSYQDFLKDIYSAMKKINQTTVDIFAKLDVLDSRIANLEKGYVMLSEDIKKNVTGSVPVSPAKQPTSASRLMTLLSQLNDSKNDIIDTPKVPWSRNFNYTPHCTDNLSLGSTGINVYTLGANTILESLQPSPELNCFPSAQAELLAAEEPEENNYEPLNNNNVKREIIKSNLQNDDFMIL
jgi:hypothetical protein